MDKAQLDAIVYVLKYSSDVSKLRAVARGLLLEVRNLNKELDRITYTTHQEIRDGEATEASEATDSR